MGCEPDRQRRAINLKKSYKKRYHFKNIAKANAARKACNNIVSADNPDINDTSKSPEPTADARASADNRIINDAHVSPEPGDILVTGMAGPSKQHRGYHTPQSVRRPQRTAKLLAAKKMSRDPFIANTPPLPEEVQQVRNIPSALQLPGTSKGITSRRCRDSVDILLTHTCQANGHVIMNLIIKTFIHIRPYQIKMFVNNYLFMVLFSCG